MSRPRPTVRTRLTLLYIGLFAICGAIVVAVSYILVAQLGAPELGQRPASRSGIPASIGALCRSEQTAPHPNKALMAQCVFQLLGAQHQRDLTLSHLLRYSLITLGAVIALAAILGWIAAGRALRPIHRITALAHAASASNLSARVALAGPRDELHQLASTFDEMLDRLQATFESQQRFIANAAHELRTPLAVMHTTLDVVLDNPNRTPADLPSMVADIRTAVDHAEHLIDSLLILARNERGLTTNDEIDLATVAEDILDTTDHGNLQLHRTLEPAVITGDPVLAERLLANLIDNAVRYNHPGGQIWINIRTTNRTSQLTIANTGPPISSADIDRIFQPFQRLNDRISQNGFGLGLTIVSSITAIHNGTVTAQPRAGGGLTVTITIPTTDTPAPREDLRQRSLPQKPSPEP